jgi:hypothetical protein
MLIISLIKLNLSNNNSYVVWFTARVITASLSRVLRERTVIVLTVAQLFGRSCKTIRRLCLRRHSLLLQPLVICLIQAEHDIIIEEVIEDTISGQNDNVFILNYMSVNIGISRRLIVSSALIRVVKSILLLL